MRASLVSVTHPVTHASLRFTSLMDTASFFNSPCALSRDAFQHMYLHDKSCGLHAAAAVS